MNITQQNHIKRYYYSSSIKDFLIVSYHEILGELTANSEFNVELSQREAWKHQVSFLQERLVSYEGSIFFEYSIPRMGRRIDVVLIIQNVIFILEFKVG